MVTRSAPGVVHERSQGLGTARQGLASRPTDQQAKRLAEICSPWQGRQSPASAVEEIAFVEDLLDLVGGEVDVEFERRDVTVLVTALRNGLSVPQVRGQAPGIDPSRLLSAYREVDRRRSFAERAWSALEQDGTTDGVMRYGELAGQLLPAVVTRLAAFLGDEGRFELELAKAREQVVRTTRRVRLLEDRVVASADDPERARELGTLLYDVYGHGAWSLETYLPPRVGTLVPLRLAALLGEDITAQRRMS
jgi:hypothetical protein